MFVTRFISTERSAVFMYLIVKGQTTLNYGISNLTSNAPILLNVIFCFFSSPQTPNSFTATLVKHMQNPQASSSPSSRCRYHLALTALLLSAILSSFADAFTPSLHRQKSRLLLVNRALSSTTATSLAVLSNPLASSDLDQNYGGLFTFGVANNIVPTDGMLKLPHHERYKAISLQAVDKVAERHPALLPHLHDVKLAGMVFPFKASPYYVDELIDWDAEDVRQDPFYRLVFPTLDMLRKDHRSKLEAAYAEGNPKKLLGTVDEIRADLNPHPAGQKDLNSPKDNSLTGVQHKYSETVLVFPAAGQTCHAYCTYCFRWAQFIGDDELRFAQKEAHSLFRYLSQHEEVSDILMTGGDPMVMKTKSLAQYLEPFTNPNFLPHIKNIRIGTRSLTFWPQRFTTDDDADEVIELLRRVHEVGGRHVAIMAHLSHPRELSTSKVKATIRRLQKEAYTTIRSQSPVMRGINDQPEVWADESIYKNIFPFCLHPCLLYSSFFSFFTQRAEVAN
eukprot:CCRYP_001131-RB/>CCRYP_001131-RB protein AED:0.01 eAED:0.01 QI:140/1/1/1/1/1/3/1629/505